MSEMKIDFEKKLRAYFSDENDYRLVAELVNDIIGEDEWIGKKCLPTEIYVKNELREEQRKRARKMGLEL